MDREVLKLMAHMDQTRSTVRSAIKGMAPEDLVELFRDCTAGRLAAMDERCQLLVGLLAAIAIHDLCQNREDGDDSTPYAPTCPHCGEDDIDRLVWLDDEKVRCASCGTVYEPNGPDAEA